MPEIFRFLLYKNDHVSGMLLGNLNILVHRAIGSSQPEGPQREKHVALKSLDLIGQILELGFHLFNAGFPTKISVVDL